MIAMGLVGLEPTFHDLKDRCLIRLGHRPTNSRACGIRTRDLQLERLTA
jgi:hypothetical protein